MANGHVEIHDPVSNHSNLTTSSTNGDPKSTSDTVSMEDTVELRLLMAYAKRRRPEKDNKDSTTQDSRAAPKEPSSPQTPAKTEKDEKEKKKKKKRKGGKLLKIFSCINPQSKDGEPVQTTNVSKPDADVRCGDITHDDVREDNKLEGVASRLTEIADDIPFTPPEVEADSDEDDVEKVIGLLLREAGDRLDEQLKDALIAAELFWNYGFFEKLIRTLMVRMGLIASEPDALGPQASPKSQIAVTCEVTSRLSAVETLPMSRMLDHGARYLRDHYSSWAQQHGGYEEAFYSDEEDDSQ